MNVEQFEAQKRDRMIQESIDEAAKIRDDVGKIITALAAFNAGRDWDDKVDMGPIAKALGDVAGKIAELHQELSGS